MKDKKKNSNNSISYSGVVTVKLEKNGKPVRVSKGHNSGQLPLFTFLAESLSGNFNIDFAPRYIRVFDEHGEQVVDSVAIIDSESISNVDTATAKLTFIIQGNLFTSGKVGKTLALYSRNGINSDSMATYDFEDGQELSNISDDTNVIIIWELTVGNQLTNN